MEPKKTDRANLENKRGIFLQIGLIITLALIMAAFEWSSESNYDSSFEIPDDVFLGIQKSQVSGNCCRK